MDNYEQSKLGPIGNMPRRFVTEYLSDSMVRRRSSVHFGGKTFLPENYVVATFIDPAPARSLLFFVVDSVCLFVTLLQKSILLLCFSMESSHFLAISSP